MDAQSLLTGRRIAAFLLIACAAVFAVGRMLLTGRVVWKWPAGQTDAYLRWERGFVILAVLVTALGLVVLEDLLRAAGEAVISRLALVTYSFGAVVVVVAETSYLHSANGPQVVCYVVLALLAQAMFGVALFRTGLVAGGGHG
jgi:hypothetical protein